MEMVVGKEQSECGGKSQSAMEIYSLITFYESDFEKLKKQEGGKTRRNNKNGNHHSLVFIKLTLMHLSKPNQERMEWGFVARGNNGEFLEGDVVT